MKFQWQIKPMRCEARLRKQMRHDVDTHHAVSTSFLHFKRTKSGVATDVEHRLAAQVLWKAAFENAPTACRVIRTRWIGHDPRGEHNIVVPRSEPLNGIGNLCTRLRSTYRQPIPKIADIGS